MSIQYLVRVMSESDSSKTIDATDSSGPALSMDSREGKKNLSGSSPGTLFAVVLGLGTVVKDVISGHKGFEWIRMCDYVENMLPKSHRLSRYRCAARGLSFLPCPSCAEGRTSGPCPSLL